MGQLKVYKNKKIGEFYSIPLNLINKSSVLDSLYLALNFDKLHSKSVIDIRSSNHYKSTLASWDSKLQGVELSDLGEVAKALRVNVKVFNPLVIESHKLTTFTGGNTKRSAELLKCKTGVYKPMRIGGVAVPQPLLNNTPLNNKPRQFITKNKQLDRRPLRNITQNTHDKMQRQNAYVITDAFKFEAFDGSNVDMSEIINLIQNKSITPEMIMTYLLIGDAKCNKGIQLVLRNKESQEHLRTDLVNQNILLLSQLDSQSYALEYGSIVKINLELLKRQIYGIENQIQASKNVKYNSTRPLFYTLPEDTDAEVYSAGAFFSRKPKKPPRAAPPPNRTPNRAISERRPPGTTLHQPDITYLSKDEALHDTDYKGRRHVIKATINIDDYSVLHRVIKIAVDPTYDIEYKLEAENYTTFKNKFPQFYRENVLQFFGTGIPEPDGAIRLEDDNQNEILLQLPLDKIYSERRYLVTEWNPELVIVENFVKGHYSDYNRFAKLNPGKDYKTVTDYENPRDALFAAMVNVLITAKKANTTCQFTHGDMHWQNVFIDQDKNDKPILFDFDFSSFGPKVSEKVLNNFQNKYLLRQHYKPNFDTQYAWYMDCIRFIMYGAYRILKVEAVDSYSAEDEINDEDNVLEIEMKLLIETVFDMIPKGDDLFRRSWHRVMWNGSKLCGDDDPRSNAATSVLNQQAHSFVSPVKVIHKRKIGYHNDWVAILKSLVSICNDIPDHEKCNKIF